MDVVLSGIRSTGHLHLGNYFGALKNFVRIQDTHRCYFFIADLHSLTTHPHPEDLHEGVKTILAEYLAAGLDPEKSAIFVQSEVPEVCELYVLLNMLAYKGELFVITVNFCVVRCPDRISMGLNFPHAGGTLMRIDDEGDVEAQLVDALRLTSKFTTYVAPPFVTIDTQNLTFRVTEV